MAGTTLPPGNFKYHSFVEYTTEAPSLEDSFPALS